MKGNQGADLNLKQELIERHLENRKREVQKILSSERIRPKEEKQKKIEHFFASEVPEDIQMVYNPEDIHRAEDEQEEEIKERGKLNLNQHFKKRPQKDKKKCWNCRSKFHQKKNCPYLRCFFCKRLGHLKENCLARKINFVFNRLGKISDERNKEK